MEYMPYLLVYGTPALAIWGAFRLIYPQKKYWMAAMYWAAIPVAFVLGVIPYFAHGPGALLLILSLAYVLQLSGTLAHLSLYRYANNEISTAKCVVFTVISGGLLLGLVAAVGIGMFNFY